MPSFSVRKPLTVFVAVIAVIVLGIVAFTNMTPDLLPNLDMPYVVVVTPYPGSTPEKTETNVTRPLERSLATLENIVNIDSTSGPNSATIILEFNTDVNMETVTVDILQKVQQVEGSFDDMVGSPVIMKINPSMLPVMVAAVEMEGMDNTELSALMKNELQNKVEGIDGVASVSYSGMIEETVQVVLSESRLDELNRKVQKAIDEQFEEPQSELEDAKKELETASPSLGLGLPSTSSIENNLSSEAQALTNEAKTELQKQLDTAKGQLAELEKAEAGMKDGYEQVLAVQQAVAATKQTYDALVGAQAQQQVIQNGWNGLVTAASGVPSFPATNDADRRAWFLTNPDAAPFADAFNPWYAGWLQLGLQLDALDVTQGPDGPLDPVTSTALAAKTLEAQGLYELALYQQQSIETMLAGATPPMSIQQVLDGWDQLQQGKQALQTNIALLEGLMKQLDSGALDTSDITGRLEGLIDTSSFDLSGLSGMASAMIDGQMQQAMAQVDSGLKQLETARDTAKKQANPHNLITLDTLSQILTAQNFSMPVGYVQDGKTAVMVSVGEEIATVDELRDLVLFDLQLDGLDPIRLSDVADVFIQDNSADVYAKINGNDGVLLTFNKQSTYATATVTENIQKRFDQLSAEYEGLNFYSMMDQGDYIYLVVNSILENLLWGALFAIIVLLLFLKDLRPTFITLCSIPISVIFAIALMYFSGVTINIISLSGLAVAVGMLVDNSIVVLENIFRLRALGASPVKAAISGATQMAAAITSSTLTTVCVFLPIVFVEGITRQLFTDLALTLGYSLVASLIVALTLVPAMSSGMMRGYKAKENRTFDRVMNWYRKSVKLALNHKVLVLVGSVALLVLSAGLVLMRGFSFMPSMEMPQLTVSVTLDEEADAEQTKAVTDEVIARIEGIDGVATTGAMLNSTAGGIMGFSLGGGGGGENASSIYVLLDDDAQNRSSEIGDAIVDACADLDAEVTPSSSSGMSIDMLAGSGVTVELYGNDMDQLQATARALAAEVEKVPGTTEVSDGIGETDPEMRFVVDKARAMEEGLTTAQVYMEVAKALAIERTATAITYEGNDYDVIVVTGAQEELTPQYLRDYSFTVTGRDGEDKQVWLRNLVTIEETESKTSISRHNQQRYLSVSASIAEGNNVSLVTADVQRALQEYELPAGMRLEYSGENESIMEAFTDLLLMLALGILLVYLIMVAQFQSLKSPFIVMFTIPLAFTGGFLALLVTGLELSVISLIGFVMLVGIVVNNGIVLVDYINQLRLEGTERRAAIEEAGVTRMRPILMTSITTVLGLSVMAFGVGMGSDLMQPIAITCIGGMLYATLMTLYVVPVMYDMFNKKELRKIDDEDLEIIEE